jgi:hypothetical protein
MVLQPLCIGGGTRHELIMMAKDVTATVLRTLDRHSILHFNAVPNVGLDLNAQICAEVEGLVRGLV